VAGVDLNPGMLSVARAATGNKLAFQRIHPMA
jgi:hypothetical protein